MPAASSARSSTRPAGPTNGLPARSSSWPGCSPTIITRARFGPSPKTVCVPRVHSGQPRQPAAASRSVASVRYSGKKSAAEPVEDARLTRGSTRDRESPRLESSPPGRRRHIGRPLGPTDGRATPEERSKLMLRRSKHDAGESQRQQRAGGGDDRGGVDAVVTVEIGARAGLAEILDAERLLRHT